MTAEAGGRVDDRPAQGVTSREMESLQDQTRAGKEITQRRRMKKANYRTGADWGEREGAWRLLSARYR